MSAIVRGGMVLSAAWFCPRHGFGRGMVLSAALYHLLHSFLNSLKTLLKTIRLTEIFSKFSRNSLKISQNSLKFMQNSPKNLSKVSQILSKFSRISYKFCKIYQEFEKFVKILSQFSPVWLCALEDELLCCIATIVVCINFLCIKEEINVEAYCPRRLSRKRFWSA